MHEHRATILPARPYMDRKATIMSGQVQVSLVDVRPCSIPKAVHRPERSHHRRHQRFPAACKAVIGQSVNNSDTFAQRHTEARWFSSLKSTEKLIDNQFKQFCERTKDGWEHLWFKSSEESTVHVWLMHIEAHELENGIEYLLEALIR